MMAIYTKVEIEGQHGYIVARNVSELLGIVESSVFGDAADFEDWVAGEKIIITTIEMTPEEFDDLGEFPGW